MNIAIEAQRLFRRKKHGMEIVALEVIRQLQKTDTINRYTIFAKGGDDNNCISESKNFSIDISQKGSYPVWEQIKLPKIINKLKPDVLHCTANTAPLNCSVPLIITIHDVIYMESVSFAGSSYQNFGNLYRRFVVPKVAQKAEAIITVSHYEKSIIAERLNLPQEKIHVVYNGVNDQFKQIKRDELNVFRETYDLPEKFILHFANTAPKKNTIGALKAYSIYCKKTLAPVPLIVTDCKRDLITGLLKEINNEQLINNIRILDYVPFNNIPMLYNLATIFLYPSHRESFGMPVIEAMACGVPVITSDTSALPEIAGGAACLADPKNPEAISEHIIHLLTESGFYKHKQQAGFKNATRFNWRIAAEQTLEIYKKIYHLKNKSKQLVTE